MLDSAVARKGGTLSYLVLLILDEDIAAKFIIVGHLNCSNL